MQRLKSNNHNLSHVFELGGREDLIKDGDIGRIWGIPRDIVVALCEANQISNCVKMGSLWLIPANSKCPDKEKINSIQTQAMQKSSLEETIEKKEQDQRARTFNGLTAKEWAENSRSVWNDVSSMREKKHLDHGATFPLKMCTRLINMYSHKDDIVLDPFLGTGTTVLAALENNRRGIGIELTDRFFEVAKEEVNQRGYNESLVYPLEKEGCRCHLIKGDCSVELFALPSDFIQLTITSPPYADLIHKVVEDRTQRHKKSAFVQDNNATTNLYSDDERDLGNMSLDEYVLAIEKIMSELFRITKKGGYNIWVVKDFRDTRNGSPYIDLHTRVASAGEKAGFKYHDLIIWDQNEQRRLVLLGYPSVFYVNQNHSYLVVLRK